MQVATDIGGTFTDVVTSDRGKVRGWKIPSTPRSPDRAVADAISTLAGISSFSHGTTVATNAVLERKGAKVAFVATRGFRDLLFLARQKRPRLYDFDCSRPAPVVDRSRCFEVNERIAPDGAVLQPLSPHETEALVERVLAAEPDAVALCLLFSFKNPVHEMMLQRAFAERGIPVSRSSEIIPEFREYERASTTAINAFVQDVVGAYVGRIGENLRQKGGPADYYIMKSGGGVAASGEVHPVELLLSGPAGGVAAGCLFAQDLGISQLVTFDMGGTSADIAAVIDGKPLRTDEAEIDGLPIRIPMLDITTIGAGGGSIAWIDRGGALRVGPQSAGADPGPACYGRGGVLPTVTDANLLCGLIDSGSFSGTRIDIYEQKAREAFTTLASLKTEEAVLGVRSVVNANMLRGIRRATVEKGIDVRYCSLLAFGGAGPLHAAELAGELGIREVLIPPLAGTFSALGILLCPVRLDFGESLLARWNSESRRQVERMLDRFKAEALKSLARQGFAGHKVRFEPVLDLRYEGQSFHLPVGYEQEADMEERFHGAFETRYGYALRPGPPLEVVTARLVAVVAREGFTLPEVKDGPPPAPAGKRSLLLPSGERSEAVVFRRRDLPRSFRARGPVVIEDEGSTVFVPPGCEISVGPRACLRIEVNRDSEAFPDASGGVSERIYE